MKMIMIIIQAILSINLQFIKKYDFLYFKDKYVDKLEI